MANFGIIAGGLASGFAAGTRIGNQLSESKFRGEAQDRQRKAWGEEDSIKAAGAKAFNEDGVSGLQSMAKESAKPPQMSTAPVNSDLSAIPGDGLNRNAEGLLSRYQQGPQIPQDGQPQGAAVLQEAAQKPEMSTAPTAQPMNAGLKSAPVDGEAVKMQRILRASNAAAEEAARMGNWDLYSKHFKTGADVRDSLRSRSMDAADRQFAVTGDWNAYTPVYNNAVDDGNRINAIEKQDKGGYLVKGVSMDGKEFARQVKDDSEMKGMVNLLTDPAGVRKMEAAKALKQFEFATKREEAVALERAKGEERIKLEGVKTAGRIEVNDKKPVGLSSRGSGGGGDSSKGAKFDVDGDGNRIILYRNGTMVYPKDGSGAPVKIKAGTDQDQKFTRDLTKIYASKDMVPPSDPVGKAKQLTRETATAPKTDTAATGRSRVYVPGQGFKDQ